MKAGLRYRVSKRGRPTTFPAVWIYGLWVSEFG